MPLSAFAEYHRHARGWVRDMLRRDVRPITEVDNRGVAVGEDGYFYGTMGSPVGLHCQRIKISMM